MVHGHVLPEVLPPPFRPLVLGSGARNAVSGAEEKLDRYRIEHLRQCSGYHGCDQTFADSAELGKHMLTHTTRRGPPFACTYGGSDRSYSREDTLSDHMRQHLLP
ncbi:Uu.00g143680.m01.CDS01 [Anthostomella pinea]|uniref:Uu.00g143680.m01.CDS01 n=1 Tax=Anthostomella pinea TaxID=933095 RepID=A0AAI8VRW4_9PEZI|nr:Uu.00g143680.m01.CDS01 [Anthostomella pinea]